MLPFPVVGYLVMPEHFHPGQRGRAGPALAKTATGMVATPFAGFERFSLARQVFFSGEAPENLSFKVWWPALEVRS